MSLQKPYISITHDDPELTTVGDFVDNGGTSIAANYIDKETDLLNYQDEVGFSNRQRIFLLYTEEEWKQYAVEGATLQQLRFNEDFIKGNDSDLLIKVGTEVLIPKEQIALDNIYTVSLEPNDTNKFTTFVSENLKALLNNPDYKSTYDLKKLGKTVDFYPQITVWIWIRSINSFLDISPFVQHLGTSSYRDGGTFEFTLAPILGQKDSTGKWYPKKSSIIGHNSNSLKNHYSAQSKLYTLDSQGELKQDNYYFHNIIQSNDLVFIRYETLDLERQDRNDNQARFNFSSYDIPGKVYDMIGFVDSNFLQISPQSAEIGINISGRDLTKTILDDGSYFYIQEFMSAIFPDLPQNKNFNDRIYGRLVTFTTQAFRSIQQSIDLVINRLSSTGYVPNDVFVGYGDRRNRLIVSEESEGQKITKHVISNSEKSAKDLIRQSREFDNIDNPGSQEEINATFNIMVIWITFLYKGDYLKANMLDGWKAYNYGGRSYIENGVINDLQGKLVGINVGDIVLFQSNTQYRKINTFASQAIHTCYSYVFNKDQKLSPDVSDKLKQGVWQIIDVEVDPSVKNIRVANTSIAEANGSLIETFRQFCDDPFVEFFTDTYQDRFKFIARRPPFNYQAWKELVDLAIDIEDENVISTNLSFDDNEVYSYYMLRPQAFLYGADTNFSLDFLPAVVFPEYVDIWGSRPYEKVTNYQPYIPKVNDKMINFDQRQIVRDLKFMVDIHAYLPFTKKGLITINGDRRIKKNTCIYLKSTNEVFYVTSVENNYIKSDTIDRTTTLVVERGMIKDYIVPRSVDGIQNKISYFNIVNTNIDEKVFQSKDNQQNAKLSADIIKDWQTTKNNSGEADVFNFFVSRRQFE